MSSFHPPFGRRVTLAATAIACALGSASAFGQTAFGAASSILIPVVADTATFKSTVTVYNPNSAVVTVSLDYFEANGLAAPGPKPCGDVDLPAKGSVALDLATSCTLGAGPHFGPLIISDVAGTSMIYGYSRTDNLQGIGFSIEGFPVTNFSTVTANVVGLKRVAATATIPAYQTNCFVASLGDAVSYDLKLFDGSGVQIGTTVSGTLNAFEEVRYLDIFAAAAAPDGDLTNVRAEFSRTSAGTQQMIGFCTVQDNTSLGADFRIAKSEAPAVEPPPPVTTPLNGPPAATWNGSIQTLLNGDPLGFAGPTASITLDATSVLSAYGGGWFGKQSTGTGSLDVGVCYQNQSGPGPITAMGSMNTIAPPSNGNADTFGYGAGSVSLDAGTYSVGLCAQNTGSNSMNRNAHASGFVFATPVAP
jgi:hypothetical protein